MATGDLKNNLSRLESELKSIKYSKSINSYGLAKGDAVCYLPLLHYILLEYSILLVTYFTDNNYDFYGKKDLKFIELLYSLLRNVFCYKPKITIQQFFSMGFAERKCLFVIDVIFQCKTLVRDLSRTEKSKKMNRNYVDNITLNPSEYPRLEYNNSPGKCILENKNSPSKSPSRFLSESIWKMNVNEVPPLPLAKPESPHDIIDDSLLYYPSEMITESRFSPSKETVKPNNVLNNCNHNEVKYSPTATSNLSISENQPLKATTLPISKSHTKHGMEFENEMRLNYTLLIKEIDIIKKRLDLLENEDCIDSIKSITLDFEGKEGIDAGKEVKEELKSIQDPSWSSALTTLQSIQNRLSLLKKF